MSDHDYDLIVIGAGSGGVRAARVAAGHGARVAICEETRVGGTCVLRGCVPKKLLVYGAHVADDIEDAAAYGWTIPEPTFDWARLIANKNTELDRLNGVYIRMLRESGVDIIDAHARIAGAHQVEAGGRTLDTEHILIATGSWPTMPRIPGIEHVISSNEALDLMALPGRIVIVGGGYIAVEFAGIFNSLGVEVTEIVRADTILRGFDEDLRTALAGEMAKRGIRLLAHTVVDAIDKAGNGYRLTLGDGSLVEADLVMYATGRAPNTAGLGLAEAGVAVDGKGAVVVDEYSSTSVPGIHAVGDVTNRANLTPVAIREGTALAETLFNDTPTAMTYDDIPTAVFSQPPIGTVGLTEAEARARAGAVDVYTSSFRPMKFSLSGRDESTFMKLIVERATDRVLGAHMMGLDAAEIIQGLGVALKCGATKAQFDATVGIHPSAAEEFVTMRNKVS